MGAQARLNKTRREIKREGQDRQNAVTVYVEGMERATRILSWVEANYQAPFAICIQVADSGMIGFEDDTFFTVAATPQEFHAKKAFLEMVATATMSLGILAVIDGPSPEQIRSGRGSVRAWMVGNDGLPEGLPVTDAATSQLRSDFPVLATYDHVAAEPMRDFPAAA